MRKRIKQVGRYVLIMLWLPGSVILAEPVTDTIIKPVEDSIAIRQRTQKDVEKWSEKKSAMEAEYDTLVENQERLSEHQEQWAEELALSRIVSDGTNS